jgi:hypothetical protein
MKKIQSIIFFSGLSLLLTACQQEVLQDRVTADEFVRYNLDGVSYELGTDTADHFLGILDTANVPTYNISNSQVSSYRWRTPNRFFILFRHPQATSSGTYPVLSIHVQQFRSKDIRLQSPPPNVTMSNIPLLVGQYFEGNIAGQFIDTSSVQHTISGNFRVKRRI